MLSQNIKSLRKEKGYTQETFAQELNVVRQTVSKWEKGYSVPDAIMLERIAELLEVSVGELLSGGEGKVEEKPDLKEVADQLSILNNQLAKELARRKRNRKIALTVIAVLILISLIAVLISLVPLNSQEYEVNADDGGIVLSALDKELDEAVSKAIISANEAEESSFGEFTAESHIVYSAEEKKGAVKVCLFESHTVFGFKDGFFTDVSGGSTPSVLTFEPRENGFVLLSRETARDGGDYVDSVKRIFPSRIAEKCLSGLTEAQSDQMWLDQADDARKYLRSIGRDDAIICPFRDIKTSFFSDYGVSDEISNKITDMGLEYDYTIGNHERIESGKRFVYQTGFDLRNNLITFTKFEYDTGKIVEFIAVDADSGETVKGAEKPEKVEYYKGELDPDGGTERTTAKP